MDNKYNDNNNEPRIGMIGVIIISTILSMIITVIIGKITDCNTGILYGIEVVVFFILVPIVLFLAR